MGSFAISEGNITRRKKNNNNNNTEYMPNSNSQQRSSPEAPASHQRLGLDREGRGCMLKVRTRTKYPEDNLKELTGDSNQNC